MKVIGFIKDGEHLVTCNCGAIIKFSNEDVVSEDIIDVDYWGVDRCKEKSITCKKCKRKILIKRV
jgi:hypothetical protein